MYIRNRSIYTRWRVSGTTVHPCMIACTGQLYYGNKHKAKDTDAMGGALALHRCIQAFTHAYAYKQNHNYPHTHTYFTCIHICT